MISIEELCDCSTLTVVFQLLLSLIHANVFGDLEMITAVDCSLASLISGPGVHAFITY